MYILIIFTYRYAQNRIDFLKANNSLRPNSLFHKWQPVTHTELEGFFAMILNMGLIELPTLQDYWSTAWTTRVPFFPMMMSRERFQLIFWLLHVGHEQTPPQRMDKVQAFLDVLLNNFQTSYMPSCELSIDETMVGFRGRFGPKQYMPKKPVRYGIKAFTMADADQGYMLNILVYTGADTLQHADPTYSSLPQPARTVLHLAEGYLDKGHHIYTDRYYSSLPLAVALGDRSTAFTGTLMRNRKGLPSPIRVASKRTANEVGMGESWFWNGKHQREKSSVIMVSTEHPAVTTTVQLSRNRGVVQIPLVVVKYNQSMNGVDRADQNSVYYSFIRKSRKWWRKLFFWLVEVAVVNSFILYKLNGHSKTTHLLYRRQVIEALAARHIQSTLPRPRPGRPRKRQLSLSGPDAERLNGHIHFLAKHQKARDCVVCSDRGKERHRSLYYCKTCTTHPTLCPTQCFEKYHLLETYK